MGSCSVCPLQCQSCSIKKGNPRLCVVSFFPFLSIHPSNLRSRQITVISIINETTNSENNRAGGLNVPVIKPQEEFNSFLEDAIFKANEGHDSRLSPTSSQRFTDLHIICYKRSNF